ncbi:hypothetical protein BX666DRAFT_1989319 [Dichotomocladium elegans]|nr:hypothetical protein BX666DRAFT_1989319 [Dichotomocladium elegans]
MADTRIYSAVYSGVAVYETVVNDVVVMRRQNDSYMNATQILKVAGIEKGKRTKILEREVLIGEHEKVQGGYGKFQGTWIPLNNSRQLAERYNVLDILKYIIDFNPPVPGNDDEEDLLPTKEQAMIAQRKLAQIQSRSEQYQPRQPRTTARQQQKYQQQQQHEEERRQQEHQQRAHHHHSPAAYHHQQRQSAPKSPLHTEEPNRKRVKPNEQQQQQQQLHQQISAPTTAASDDHRGLLMAIFLSDDPDHIPELLQSSSPAEFNIDLVIDEQGNTALHWAAALARTTIVQLLVSKGANPACTNYAGETPLMRSVMVTNSFDNSSFPSLLNSLESTILAVDQKRQTVLHHAAKTAGIHGRTPAAIYYVSHLLRLQQPTSILDWQDDRGDTALNIAAQLDCTEMVQLLTRAGAKKDMENNVGLTSEDYSDTKEMSLDEQTSNYPKQNVVKSERGREIISTVQKIVDALDEEYGGQLVQRDQELAEIQTGIDEASKELEMTRKDLESRQAQSQRLVEAQQKYRNLQTSLQAEWDRMDSTPANTSTALDEIDDNEDIDAAFAVLSTTDGEEKPRTAEQRKNHMRLLKARIAAYLQNDHDLRSEVMELRAQTAEKELQCKRLIAACCNLPIEKIDDLVEPLILAIESDPPDLDLARVIGFMEKIRRQGAFSDSLASSQSSSPPPLQPSSALTPTLTMAASTGSPLPSVNASSTTTTAPPLETESSGVRHDMPSPAEPSSNVDEPHAFT